ncbi:MAG: 5-dehydro-2-deoxygluconokinase [Clostridia bacterium]|nr:5-dehydro-2-deoxygluconokinase [Clostridia bacterium]
MLNWDRLHGRELDAVTLGRVTIDFYSTENPKPLAESDTFVRFLGGSPANTAVGLARLGSRVGFIGSVSDDQFGDYVTGVLRQEGVDVSRVMRCKTGENLGLAFTEILGDTRSSLLMYRHGAADLALSGRDIDADYLARTKVLVVSGTALSAPPSREAALAALLLAKQNGAVVVFDIDYRPHTWRDIDETSLYYALAASQADILLGSREEFDLTERLLSPGLSDPESAGFWFSRGVSLLVIKHGGEGSNAFSSDGQAWRVKPFHVRLLKGIGGGDAYAAALLRGLLDGLPLADSLENASAAAAMVVASSSCSAAMPDAEALRAFVRDGVSRFGRAVEPLTAV